MNQETYQNLLAQHGSPLYVYDGSWLAARAQEALAAAEPIGCTVRYAVKANPHPDIIRLFESHGIHFDASSEYEVEELLELGIPAEKISLSSQQPPKEMRQLLGQGIKFVATSLHQLDLARESGWQGSIAVRINPGSGSGHNQRTTTGGVGASFGIWHEYIPQILAWQEQSGSLIDRLHIHVGSGADSSVWRSVIQRALAIVQEFPSVTTLDIGGGYKVSRVKGEPETNLADVLSVFAEELQSFQTETGRALQLEIEPGTWLVANGGTLLATVVDIVDTGANGYTFLKLDTGMNDILRTTMYGAQHPITILNDATETQPYVVVGHNCESGDILTPAPGDPEMIAPRSLNKAAIGDIVAIGGAGAYCASMRALGYNSFPAAKEVLLSPSN